MGQPEAAFLPLDDFWAAFVGATTRGRAPPLEPRALVGYLQTMFGDLTEHRLRAGAALPAVFDCAACRNNGDGRNDAACRTHAGVVRGLFESATASPLEVAYDPHPDGSCTLTVERARAPDGRRLVPEARLRAGVSLAFDALGGLVQDAGRGIAVRAAPEARAVLAGLGGGAQTGALARRLGLGEAVVETVLGEAWAQGFIECGFGPEDARP